MRRKEKEITDRTVIESIILRSSVCRLALSEDSRPYIVPLCFGYKNNILYFHSARNGKKLEILKKNNKVCFEFDIDHEIVQAEDPCKWSMKYRSVIGYGKASVIDDPESKRSGLNSIVQHYAGSSLTYAEPLLKDTVLIKVEIESMRGKKSGY
jgi:nitroimidazol reductase NimA-like FMN-containing flavoprotein (pyridoxamine 5'-phosphate oxidase superfamily)